MEIIDLLRNIPVKRVIGSVDRDVTSVASDSRTVEEGALFVCLSGGKTDGHRYVLDAERRGAVAVVAERETETSLPQFIVEDSRSALALIAGNFYGNPANALKIVTVVGTNGKTSTVEILSEIMTFAGHRSATIGTLGYKVDGKRSEGTLTTPDPLELHRKLAEMLREKIEYVFLEASAHAIEYRKLAGIRARATVFTNITQDHLDFFGTMERYASVKLSYFNHANTGLAVVNADDPYGLELLRSGAVPCVSYGIDNPADVFAIDLYENEDGMTFTINAFDLIEEIKTPLYGRFNVYNVMAATATAMYFGVGLPTIAGALREMPRVPGRYEVKYVKGRRFIVDYAHTPDALEHLLTDLREHGEGRILTVFGCGGDRDRTKRPIMGRIATAYSDVTIVTDDNPRGEEEGAIAEEILCGVVEDSKVEVVLDRESAIKRAFELSAVGDRIVIAGKGHERTMEIKGVKRAYNDYDVLQELDR